MRTFRIWTRTMNKRKLINRFWNSCSKCKYEEVCDKASDLSREEVRFEEFCERNGFTFTHTRITCNKFEMGDVKNED